jgi:hypothetical protein
MMELLEARAQLVLLEVKVRRGQPELLELMARQVLQVLAQAGQRELQVCRAQRD